MQVLRISVAVVLLLNIALSLAQRSDQIVSKSFPANITCRRNGAQRSIERQLAGPDNQNLLVLFDNAK